MTAPAPALTFVIPLYQSAATIGPLLRELDGLSIDGGHEIVLVDDGSTDATAAICREFAATARVPVTLVEHARNFGEHQAVLSGWRVARGAHLVNLDDDGQQPPAEAVRLWRHALTTGADVVYGHYAEKRHARWRNLGSWFTNRMTDWAVDKPHGFYLSSFRCVSAFAAREAARHSGPSPYIDGLLLQITQRIASLEVRHEPRRAGASGYTLRRLVRLWLSAWLNFSVLPLRVATLLGLTVAVAGVIGFVVVGWLWWTDRGPAFGWGSLMASVLVFAGVQLVMLGVIGEYLGRVFLIAHQRPQSVVRGIWRRDGIGSAETQRG
jgi:undecaprenyl-phosphate 4-deoxy-4-formamido-L-arabinose transferase